MSNKMTAKSRGMLNQAHIQQVLAEPVRKAAEEKFARDHANDTDEELYALLKEMKRKQGKNLKPVKTVGLQYFEARLGRWTDVMGRINRELEAEQAETLGISAAEWELLRTMRQLSSGHVTVTVKKARSRPSARRSRPAPKLPPPPSPRLSDTKVCYFI